MIQRCCVLIVLLLAAAGARTTLGVSHAITTAEPLSQFPSAIDGWVGTDSPLDPEVVKVAAVDDYLNRSYRSDAGAIGLYVGYYQSQRQGESLHSPMQCLPGAGWQAVDNEAMAIQTGQTGSARTIKKLVLERGVDRLLVLYWYQTLKRITGNEYLRKLFLVGDAFGTGRTDVALVRVIAPIDFRNDASETQAMALARPFAERVLPEVQARLFRE